MLALKSLHDTAADIAKRMREIAAGVANPADAEAIMLYANWIEANPDADEVKELVEPHQESKPDAD